MNQKQISEKMGIPRLTLHSWKKGGGKYEWYRKILLYGMKAMSEEEIDLFIERAERQMKVEGDSCDRNGANNGGNETVRPKGV